MGGNYFIVLFEKSTKIINTKYLASAKLEFKIFFYLKIIVCIYLFGFTGSLLLHGLFSKCSEGDYSPVVCGLLTAVVSCVEEHRLQTHGLQALQL